MRDFLIVSHNEDHFHLFNQHLGHLPVHFSWGGELGDALENIPIENPAIVLLINEDFQELTQWVDAYIAAETEIPFICCSGLLQKEKRLELWKKGAADLFCFPMNRKELEYRLKSFLGTDTDKGPDRWEMRGRLEDLNLIDLIHSFEEGNKNGVLHLQKGAQRGRIEFNKGKIVNARLAKRDPLEAIEVMATWFYGRFWTQLDKEKHTKRILLDNQQIILECLNHINMQYRLLARLPAENKVLYASPDLDYEEMGPTNRNVLLLFKEGNTIQKFLENYSEKSIPVLERMIQWIKDGWLLDKDAFEKKLKQLQKEKEESGIRKMVNKIFTKSDKKSAPKHPDSGESSKQFEEEEMAVSVTRRSYLFNQYSTLDDFVQALEELS